MIPDEGHQKEKEKQKIKGERRGGQWRGKETDNVENTDADTDVCSLSLAM